MAKLDSGRPARKDAQNKITNVRYAVDGKKAKAAVQEALSLLQGRSGLSKQEKVANLEGAREQLKVAIAHPKVAGTPIAEDLQAARKDLKTALKAY